MKKLTDAWVEEGLQIRRSNSVLFSAMHLTLDPL